VRKGPMSAESLAKRNATIAQNKRINGAVKTGGTKTGRFSSKAANASPPPKKLTVKQLQEEVARLKGELEISHKSLAEVGARVQVMESGWDEFKEKWLPRLAQPRPPRFVGTPHNTMCEDGMTLGYDEDIPFEPGSSEQCNFWPSGRPPARHETRAWMAQNSSWGEIWPGAYPGTPGRLIAQMSDKHVRNSLALLLRAVRRNAGDRELQAWLRQAVERR
jgi:hypothetical protein